jgi:hypothetical protein
MNRSTIAAPSITNLNLESTKESALKNRVENRGLWSDEGEIDMTVNQTQDMIFGDELFSDVGNTKACLAVFIADHPVSQRQGWIAIFHESKIHGHGCLKSDFFKSLFRDGISSVFEAPLPTDSLRQRV